MTIIKTPISNAAISLIDCTNFVSVNKSGIMETVAMYMKPPAVNGNTQEVVPASNNEEG